ncbi:MAG: phage tail assembly protein [Thermoanaerobacter sp.]|nr:phage tail assembly protein [Thermoanaerobacter sp.]
MEIKLRKPIEKDSKTIEKLTLDLKALTGSDLVLAEREARLRGDVSLDPLFSSEGLAIVAARVSGLIPEDILGLDAPDFVLVINTVRNFLFGWVLPAQMQSEIYEKQS